MLAGRKRSATVINIGGNAPPARPCKVRNSSSTGRLGAKGQRAPNTAKAASAATVNRRSENVTEHHGAKAMAQTEAAAYTATNQVPWS
ncbi:hypothetical protein G6F22_021631 [Rhizopus arrhizus]|uniref:Uncharacterized protein n=1 Tax=Rhizopus delemar TaxID=936053 RepID=A0A9P7BYR0_9FUNG|nr:hypothetical protein G6F23_015910 [Rhizopus arrhizus]KAG0753007.1 hypothetical protein G6F22_021631 [Rhizopus arrhizus]KAG1529182.1 hypothetical protein G6F50_018172 [Rhizopus delemar]